MARTRTVSPAKQEWHERIAAGKKRREQRAEAYRKAGGPKERAKLRAREAKSARERREERAETRREERREEGVPSGPLARIPRDAPTPSLRADERAYLEEIEELKERGNELAERLDAADSRADKAEAKLEETKGLLAESQKALKKATK